MKAMIVLSSLQLILDLALKLSEEPKPEPKFDTAPHRRKRQKCPTRLMSPEAPNLCQIVGKVPQTDESRL